MPKNPKTTQDMLERARRTAMREHLKHDNVTGVDIGFRWKRSRQKEEQPRRQDQLVVRIHLREKLQEDHVPVSELLPREIEGVPVDVIEGNYRPANAAGGVPNRKRFGKLLGGISISREAGETGTLGALVVDRVSGRPGLLSNWHVLAGPRAQANLDRIVQPGIREDPTPAGNEIAVLGPSHLDRDGDAAVAWLTGTRDWLPFIFGLNVSPNGTAMASVGDILVKAGRTTGNTRAIVDGIGTYKGDYEIFPGFIQSVEFAGFKLVPEVPGNPGNVEISMRGDSGSVWLDANTSAGVGLHALGVDSPNRPAAAEEAVACHMPTVLNRLGVDLATPQSIMPQGVDPSTMTPEHDAVDVEFKRLAPGQVAVPVPVLLDLLQSAYGRGDHVTQTVATRAGRSDCRIPLVTNSSEPDAPIAELLLRCLRDRE